MSQIWLTRVRVTLIHLLFTILCFFPIQLKICIEILSSQKTSDPHERNVMQSYVWNQSGKQLCLNCFLMWTFLIVHNEIVQKFTD